MRQPATVATWMSGLRPTARGRGGQRDGITHDDLVLALLSGGPMRLALLVVTVLAAIDPTPAEACTPPPCWDGAFLPQTGATIPANAPGLVWRPIVSQLAGRLADPSRVTLTTAADPTPLAFTATELSNGTVLLVPDAPLVVGTRYVLTDTHTCELTGAPGPQVTFDVGAAAPLPTRLGTPSAAEPVIGPLRVAASGTCNATIEAAHVDVTLVADPAAAPWLPLLQLSTRVDGRPWRARADINDLFPLGESWTGLGRDRLYGACTPDPELGGLALGAHVVTFEARLPGATTVLASEPLEVSLGCDADGAGDDGGCAAGGVGASPWLGLAVLVVRRRRRRA